MSLYVIRPISDRTAFAGRHKSSPFRARWSDTRTLLARELRALSARNAVLEIDVTEAQIRLDGEIRADARPAGPAVRLAFESKYGPLTYATDAFSSWQDNVRAIALGLEALRRVDRYGITRRGEQYAGWKALPPGTALGVASHMTKSTAVEIIRTEAGLSQHEMRVVEMAVAIRSAKANAHPDRNHGDRSRWDAVEQATLVLDRSA